ncbi:unnamed protein product [Penicillium bialowiezense]
MKSSTVLMGLFALIPSTLAATCTANELYCGDYLVRVRSWDKDVLNNHIKHSTTINHGYTYDEVLFKCSPDGLEVSTDEGCECGCIETGEQGENDRCSQCF